MSAWRYLTVDGIVATRPCKLLSVILTSDTTGVGKVVLYDETSGVTGQEIATLLCPDDQSVQFTFAGLELRRGLYVDIVEKVTCVTVEWQPLPTD